MLDDAAAVEIRVQNISREDCTFFEHVLSKWAQDRREHPVQGGAHQAQLMHGSLRLDVTRLINDGILTWHDTLAAVPGPAGQPPAADPLEMLLEPQYERGTGELLAPPLPDNSQLLPGGTAAAKRRQLAEACMGEWGEAAGSEVPSIDAAAPKRRRLPMGKCHNCGSYRHGISNCPLPIDRARVSAATAEHRAARGTDNPMTQMRLRYFDSGLGAAAKKGGPDFVPGVISKQLAEALGIPQTAPPPWLSRQVALGLPPQYAKENEEAAAGGEAAEAGEQLMVFFHGSDDEGDAAAGAAASHGDAIADHHGADAANGAGASSSSSDDEDAFIPFTTSQEPVDGKPGTAAQKEQQPGSTAADQGVQQAEAGQVQQQQPQQQQQQSTDPPDHLNHQQQPKDNPSAKLWTLPGVNSDPPPGADWAQALQSAAWLKGRLG